MPVLCWHYTPSLWPWSLWTLSCTVSMTTTQGRLLVTCVGGFACTEWELHNRLKREGERESLWQCSACWNENQLYESCNGAITEHVADDGEVAVFLFIQTDISHINTLHNCSGSHYSSNPECLSCGTQLACERSKKKPEMPLTCSRPLDEGIMASSYRPWAPCLSSCGRKSCHLMWRGPLWLRQAKHHIALRISLVALTCFACPHNWDAGWWFVEA